jgi:catechol 2,3-dioxygenase-like lactoylglutathione lyase family enzyme
MFEGAAWGGDGVDIESVASVAVITPDAAASRRLYVDALGLPLRQLDGDNFASQEIDGCQHFGVWPLSQAAEACFGTSSWPAHVAVPQMSLEFELADPRAVAEGRTSFSWLPAVARREEGAVGTDGCASAVT